MFQLLLVNRIQIAIVPSTTLPTTKIHLGGTQKNSVDCQKFPFKFWRTGSSIDRRALFLICPGPIVNMWKFSSSQVHFWTDRPTDWPSDRLRQRQPGFPNLVCRKTCHAKILRCWPAFFLRIERCELLAIRTLAAVWPAMRVPTMPN